MKRFKKIFTSLYFELLIAVAISISISFCIFLLFDFINVKIYFSNWTNQTYVEEQISIDVEDFKAYVADNNVKSTDFNAINSWSNAHELVYFYIKKGGYTTYNSTVVEYLFDLDENVENLSEEELDYILDEELYESNYAAYKIRFADGDGYLYIWGDYAYQLYNRIYVASVLVCSLIAIIILVFFIRIKIHYIKSITNGIKILEGGNLTYQIPVQGQDELSQVANSLNSMRIALSQQIENERKALQANNSLVTALSHDLRTPLTTQMGYLEILKEHHYNSQEELDEYLNTALNTCLQIKEMSDRLFEYFLAFDPNPKRPDDALEEYDGMELFMQIIGELSTPLIEQGFSFVIDEPKNNFILHINMDDFLRIFNNVFTNIDKYANEAEPININFNITKDFVTICLGNKIRHEPRKNESAKIGLISISSLMKRQGGSSLTRTSDDNFTIELKFPRF